mgnify:CR=1 FL=1
MDNKKLENKADKQKKKVKDVVYTTTENYPGLPKGFKLPLNKVTAEKFIKKGYVKK